MFFLFQNSHNSTIFGFKNTTKPISPLNNVPKTQNDKEFSKIFKTLHLMQILIIYVIFIIQSINVWPMPKSSLLTKNKCIEIFHAMKKSGGFFLKKHNWW